MSLATSASGDVIETGAQRDRHPVGWAMAGLALVLLAGLYVVLLTRWPVAAGWVLSLVVAASVSSWVTGRNLRAENEALRKLHDAWNSSEKREDYAELGPVTGPTKTVELFDQDALAGMREQADGVWCAKSVEGWCAVVPDAEPGEGSDFVETVCGYGITLPGGYDRRRPDCPECIVTADASRRGLDVTPWLRPGELIGGTRDCPEAGGCRRPEQCETGCHWRRLDALNRPLVDGGFPRALPEGRLD